MEGKMRCPRCNSLLVYARKIKKPKYRCGSCHHTFNTQMQVKGIITMPKEQAQKEWKNYREVLVRRQEKYLMQMYECLSHMRRGRKLLDVFEAIKKAGLNEKQEPRLAIARADFKRVYFHKQDDGRGFYSDSVSTYGWRKDKIVDLPENTFDDWMRDENGYSIKEPRRLETKVPIIPPQFLPRGKLSNYFVLWEVKDWKAVPKDPILLKRLTNNLFAVLAVWNLTPLEQAIIKGR